MEIKFGNYVLIAFAMLVFSCTPNKVETLISDYEQTIENTKTDLSLKIEKLKQNGIISASDSINFYQNQLDSLKRQTYSDKSKSDTLSNKYLVQILNEAYIRTSTSYVNYGGQILKEASKRDEEMFMLAERYDKALNEMLKKPSNEILAKKYNCTYTIKNPILNNAKQTIIKNYLIAPDESKILKVLE
ncbi:MAG: hypothetical protein AB7U05_09535 [Mangrovibacterium sp.]